MVVFVVLVTVVIDVVFGISGLFLFGDYGDVLIRSMEKEKVGVGF